MIPFKISKTVKVLKSSYFQTNIIVYTLIQLNSFFFLQKLNEAAALYEKADCYDQAASVYIQLKNWTKLGELLPKVTSPKIHLQYAKVARSKRYAKYASSNMKVWKILV